MKKNRLFQDAIDGVTPLVQRKTSRCVKKSLPQARPISGTNNQPLTRDDLETPEWIEANAPLFYQKSHLPEKTLRKLKKGQYNIESEIDLHGLTVVQAQDILKTFLTHCRQAETRVIRVVHGKGSILKSYVNTWLRELPFVLAFSTAVPKQGCTGALIVLLKKGENIEI